MTQERAGAVDFTVPFMDSQLVIMAKEVNRKVKVKCILCPRQLNNLDVSNFEILKKLCQIT